VEERTIKQEDIMERDLFDKKMHEGMDLIVVKAHDIENELLRVYGIKTDLRAEKCQRKEGVPFYVSISQECIMTGAQLGILGETIYAVDLDIVMSAYEQDEPGKGDDLVFSGTIHLRWRHKNGGSNGSSIGYLFFDPKEFGREIGRGRGRFTIKKGVAL
jgi:hypothetical protein